MNGFLSMWTIYDHPDDCPLCFIARRWLIVSGNPDPVHTDEILMADTLDELRAKLPPGLACFSRDPTDPASVVETWL